MSFIIKYSTYVYRIYPNKKQREMIDINFAACRVVYNCFLNYRDQTYIKFKSYKKGCIKSGLILDKVKFNNNTKRLTIPMIKQRYPWLKKADSLALCAEYNNLNKAYKNFFRHNCKAPKFKRRKDKNTYITSLVNNNIRIAKDKIRLPKLGFVKIKLHRNLLKNCKIKRCVIKNDKVGRYYVCIVICFEDKTAKHENFNKIVGLDFKIGDIYVSSDGQKPIYSMPYRNAIQKLRHFEKSLKRKRKFSKRWWKNLRKIQNLHKKISFRRKDFLHKLSTKLVKNYDMISIETLSIVDISKKLSSGINIYDTSYYRFCAMLWYKLNYEQKRLVRIGKWYPSSKMCNNCGNIKEDLTLDDRVYICNKCGMTIDRDLNAAINIKNEGERLLQKMCI